MWASLLTSSRSLPRPRMCQLTAATTASPQSYSSRSSWRFVPDLGESAHGLGYLDEPAAHTRFDRVGRIDVLNVRGGELQELLRISIEQPRFVQVAHDFDVLL